MEKKKKIKIKTTKLKGKTRIKLTKIKFMK